MAISQIGHSGKFQQDQRLGIDLNREDNRKTKVGDPGREERKRGRPIERREWKSLLHPGIVLLPFFRKPGGSLKRRRLHEVSLG